MRGSRIVVLVAVLVLLAVGITLVVKFAGGGSSSEPTPSHGTSTGSSSPIPSVALSSPSDTRAVVSPTALTGRITGVAADEDLWFGIQGPGQPRVNTSDKPCAVNAETFDCGQLYVGSGAADKGKTFTLSLVVVKRGGEAERALLDYAARDKSKPGSYDGIDLPSGAVVADPRIDLILA